MPTPNFLPTSNAAGVCPKVYSSRNRNMKAVCGQTYHVTTAARVEETNGGRYLDTANLGWSAKSASASSTLHSAIQDVTLEEERERKECTMHKKMPVYKEATTGILVGNMCTVCVQCKYGLVHDDPCCYVGQPEHTHDLHMIMGIVECEQNCRTCPTLLADFGVHYVSRQCRLESHQCIQAFTASEVACHELAVSYGFGGLRFLKNL